MNQLQRNSVIRLAMSLTAFVDAFSASATTFGERHTGRRVGQSPLFSSRTESITVAESAEVKEVNVALGLNAVIDCGIRS